MARKLEDMMENLMVIQKNQISTTERMVLGLTERYQKHDMRLIAVEHDIADLKLNEEITHEQNREFKLKAHSRVHDMIDYEKEPQYFRIFITDLYKYLRQSYQLGNPIAVTRKKHYDTVMKGIEAWHPDIQGLKDRKDKRDKNKEVI